MTAPYTTPKLDLFVDPTNESDIGPQEVNWNNVDTGAGIRYVDDENEIPTWERYNGQLVCLKSKGFIWWWEGAGATWTKHYISYPWVYGAWYNSTAPPSNTNFGWTNHDPSLSYNTSKTNDSTASPENAIIIPVKGIYTGNITCRWTGDTNPGARSIRLVVNGVILGETEHREENNTPYATVIMFAISRVLNAGDTILHNVSHTTPVTGSLYTAIRLHMLRPIS